MPRKTSKIIAIALSFVLFIQQSGFAQVAGQLDISGVLTSLHSSLSQDKFRPLHLRYLSYDNLNNSFNLLLDKGDFNKGLSPKGTDPKTKGTVPKERLEQETQTLLNYFFVGISLPNDSFWVNLRPDSPENIIDDYLAQTDVGKILLEADLQLKKDTALATSPQTPEGKKYWDKLYQKAEELFGQENITIPTLTRPWIVPGEIIIRESEGNAYIYKATLKVMLEEDYLRDSPLRGQSLYSFKDPRLKALNAYSSQLLRELIIPKLTKEVNTSKRYAPLRQVYYSLILAQWFKARFYGKGGLYSWLIDKKNLTNLTSKDRWSKQAYFKQYQTSFKDGEYNLKEPVQTSYGQSVRSYFSGGIIPIPKSMPPRPTAASPVATIDSVTTIGSFRKSGSSPILNRNAILASVEFSGPATGNIDPTDINIVVSSEAASFPAGQQPASSPAQSGDGAEPLRILLQRDYDIDLEYDVKSYIDDFSEVFTFLLSLIPKKILTVRIRRFSLAPQLRSFDALREEGLYDPVNQIASLYPNAFKYWDVYGVARLFLHEIGHAFEGALSSEEKKAFMEAHEVLRVKAKQGHSGYSVLLPSDKNTILDRSTQDTIMGYLDEKPEASEGGHYMGQLLAEMFRQFILNGEELRGLIAAQQDVDVRKALATMYGIYQNKFGREFYENDLGELPGILNRLEDKAAARTSEAFNLWSPADIAQYPGVRGELKRQFGITHQDYFELQREAHTQGLRNPSYAMIRARIQEAASSPLAQPQQAKEGAVSPLLAETPESTTSSPVIKPITSSSILPSQNTGAQTEDIIEEAQTTITQALVGQINNVSQGGLKGKYRVVNIGSTARQTHIFEMDSKDFDLDFMILFEEQGDLDNFLDNYSNALADTESIFRNSGFSIKHQGAGKNRRGDSKISYFIKDGAREFKLEVNVSREKKIYADWFKEQEAQVVQLGGNAEFLRYEIKRMKRLVRQLGIYRLYEGGMGSVGIEQLIMQSAGASNHGRKIEGAGDFYRALDLLCDAGLDKRGEIIPWQKAKEKISIFDPETGEDFMVRLDEASWYSLVGLAKEYLSRAYRRRSRDDLPVEFLGGKEQARAWAPEAVEHDSVDGYVARMRAFGSGHVAVHISDLALLPTILKKGALLPRIYTQSYADIESQASVLSYPTKFLHFIVDGFYSGEHGYRGNTVAFLAAVEPVLENKAFTFLPQQGKEWEVTGFTDSAYDESNRFYINATGILFVPADLENDQEFQKLLQSLPYQPRIHYYKAKTVQEGIADFLAQQDIKPKDSLVLSGYVEQIGTKDNRLVYAVISPWSGVNRGVEVKDVPQTAEECAVTALQLFLIPNGRGQTPEAYQLAQRAYELNPSSARANLAKGLYYSHYLESKKGKDLPARLREKITYFEQALQLGLSQRYEIIALDRLIELYPQVFAFESQIKAIERYVRSVGITDLQRTRREQELQRTKQAKTGLERLIQRIGSCTSLNDLSQLLTDVSYLDYYMSRYAFQQFCMRLSQLLPAEFQALLQTSQERIRLEKRNPGFNAYSLRKGMIDDLNMLLNSIDNLLLASHRNLVTPFYREDRDFQQDANEYFEDGYRIVEEWRSDFRTRIDAELQRAEREAELWYRLRWDITTLFENTVNPEINRQDAKSAHQYYNAIRRDIRRLSGDKSWQELQEMGVDTSELRVQITRLIEQAEVKIDAALKELEKRGFIKKAVDRMQPNIRIPKDYKMRKDFQFIPPGSESIISLPSSQQGDRASSPAESVFTQDGRLNLSALQQILQAAIPEAQRERIRPQIFGSAAYLSDRGFVELTAIDDVDIGLESPELFSHKNYAESLRNIFSQAWGEQRVTGIESFAMPHEFEGPEALSYYYFYITGAQQGHRLKITVPPSTSTDIAGFVAENIATIVNTPEDMLDKPIKRNLLLVAYLGGYLNEAPTMDTLRTEYTGIMRMPEGSGKDNALKQFEAKLSGISARLKERYRSEIVGQEAKLSGLTDFIRQQLHAAIASSPTQAWPEAQRHHAVGAGQWAEAGYESINGFLVHREIPPPVREHIINLFLDEGFSGALKRYGILIFDVTAALQGNEMMMIAPRTWVNNNMQYGIHIRNGLPEGANADLFYSASNLTKDLLHEVGHRVWQDLSEDERAEFKRLFDAAPAFGKANHGDIAEESFANWLAYLGTDLESFVPANCLEYIKSIRAKSGVPLKSGSSPVRSAAILNLREKVQEIIGEEGGLQQENIYLRLGSIIAETMGIQGEEKAGKTPQGLLNEILIEPSEKSRQDHIYQFQLLFPKFLGTLRQVLTNWNFVIRTQERKLTQQEKNTLQHVAICLDELTATVSPAEGSASSPLIPQEERPGGIDFRGLPIITQPVLPTTFRDSPLPVSSNSLRRGQSLSNVNLDTEWRQIQKMLAAGIIPSSERIKEYLQGCYQNEDMDKEIDKVLACIADILRLEEENCSNTDSGLKDMLVLLESDKPANELQAGLNRITVAPKEPAIKP